LDRREDFCGLAALERALGGFDGGIEQAFFDLVERIALFDEVALLELDPSR